jgi:hypothetical protein
MQKKRYTKNIGILVTNESFNQLIEVTDEQEITVSKFIRQLIEEKLNETGREKNNER